MLRTKSILAPKDGADGVLVSIMSRHTLNDGITPHPKINDSSYDMWWPMFAPSDKLLGDYYKRNLPWSSFEQSYLNFLRTFEMQEAVKNIVELAHEMTFTMMCIEESPDYCHRMLLAQECKRYDPSLEVLIR